MNQQEVVSILDGVTAPISRIEEKLGMPRSTIQNVVNGKRSLSKEWSAKLKGFVERKEYIGLKRKPRKEIKAAPIKENKVQNKDISDFWRQRFAKKNGIKD